MGKVLPLLALRAFTETGRTGSIKSAAETMGVTSGAVSQQIRLLEERTGVTLFRRTRYGVELTEVGAGVYPALMRAFTQIETSLAVLEASTNRQTLTVSTLPSFAASWLVPRLGKFMEQNQEIEVRVEATSGLTNLHGGRVDIAIRHGLGDYPSYDVQPLMAPELVPVMCPALLASGPVIREPSDCLAYPLLQDSDRADWRLWLTACGVEPTAEAERGPAFDDDFLLLRAAEAGQGIALVRDIYARSEIAAGRLALAIDRPWPTQFAYYVLTLPENAQKPAVKLFIEWLHQEANAQNM
ncbi:LysR substrate-binding domain-containing protein [Pseudochrobactrum sp. sp1633]|uniref:LysR substrate-binding domain-containing protein n=1 Tax=Pseudochrobactrum sp. sp1633 TaxID=3036706 RepID=UPI0025A597A1|nr:LysR substrate-binding domain-containing protein [Pseudochrobactrum sp. sp1633]MDM8346997.1 LysR substrate-binding domain-containing protein [Pseudochrobactrum sp. sp1633]HWD11830.1 LysR substrate-binding domain-containing protein [Pseudochrobactrum sp.]